LSIGSKLRRARRLTIAEWRLLLKAVWLLWGAAILTRHRTLREVLAWANCEVSPGNTSGGRRMDSRKTSELVAAATRLVLPGGSCLPQALVTCRLLRLSGVQASLVIGAKTNESGLAQRALFSAHAWVQLSDSSNSTPIEFYRGEHQPLVKFG